MFDFIVSILTQAISFLPLALGISISYYMLKATDMTIDGSFVLGAATFARVVSLGYSPYYGMLIAILSGAAAGVLTASIQRKGRVDALLAGILTTFILSSFNLIIMGKPNISLLSQTTLLSKALEISDLLGFVVLGSYVSVITILILTFLKSRLGLVLRAFGDNPELLQRLKHPIEKYRLLGFALTNSLAAVSGCLTAQVIGYADIGMGFGMTLTGIGTIIFGQQLFTRFRKQTHYRIGAEMIACLIGVFLYFLLLNLLLRFDVNPIYLKMILGLVLAVCLGSSLQHRTSTQPT